MVPSCPHRPPCPGCPRFGHAEPPSEPLARLKQLCERSGIELEVRSGAYWQFRRRARLAVRGRINSPKIGIFEEGTHRVVDIPNCLVHHPLINRVASVTKAAMRRHRIAPYSDATHRGLIRSLQVVVERQRDTAQVVVVANDQTPQSTERLLRDLSSELGSDLHSLWWNGNTQVTNRILGDSWHRSIGPEHVEEEFGGVIVCFPPGAFGQNNAELFARVVEQVHDWIPDHRDVVELFAGARTVGLGLAARARSIVFNELSADSLSGLRAGIERLPGHQRARTEILPGAALEAASRIDGTHTVIVDPPRKGLQSELCHRLVKSRPRQLLYISCNVASFLTDAELLVQREQFKLDAMQVYDLFPYTEHVETLALFQRA